ncbi:hypothetical protein DC522_28015 [Microvirga sp. KLBC 81]|uniref:hypothetical protein n=1 Tax=Microvirga sp. KLBC 81 TaxID=1862707 RepID=UPI000D50C297|nr:hypothetical protein [Microvirga sp. KLBC 81]PVE21178.1 hypothetical protein DC522_28015 [Microvirga sp. KLBC 81]
MDSQSLSVWQNSRAPVQRVYNAKGPRPRPKLLESFYSTPLKPDYFEQEILQAYVQLATTPEQPNGTRTTTLARFGSVEIRLTEMPRSEDGPSYIPPFWLEVYSHDIGETIDSCGCFEFSETELAVAADVVHEHMTRAK